MMTNREKYKQAFSVLHATNNISLEVNKDINRKKVFNCKKLATACVCLALTLCVGLTVYAAKIMTDGSGLPEEIHLEFDPDTKTMLTWMAPHGVADSDDAVYIEFNNLLDRKGYDFYVKFYTPGTDMEEYIPLI